MADGRSGPGENRGSDQRHVLRLVRFAAVVARRTDRRLKHGDFRIGGEFWCGGRQWRCTDIGTRTIVAIRVDEVEVGSDRPEGRRTLNRARAEAEGWFNGPPYALGESVFDEYSQRGCSLTAGGE